MLVIRGLTRASINPPKDFLKKMDGRAMPGHDEWNWTATRDL
jgi:hypothetical protein